MLKVRLTIEKKSCPLYEKTEIVLKNRNLKYIYLDMVAYNNSASKFYLKNGFQVAKVKVDYYIIEEKHYDSHVFIWYPSTFNKELIH